MKMAMSNETMKRKVMEDISSGVEENCEAGTLHPEAQSVKRQFSRVAELRKDVDKLSAGNRDPQYFRALLAMLLVGNTPGENHIILARVFENIRHFSEAEQLDLARVPDSLVDFVNSEAKKDVKND